MVVKKNFGEKTVSRFPEKKKSERVKKGTYFEVHTTDFEQQQQLFVKTQKPYIYIFQKKCTIYLFIHVYTGLYNTKSGWQKS